MTHIKRLGDCFKHSIFYRLFWNRMTFPFRDTRFSLKNIYSETFYLNDKYIGRLNWQVNRKGSNEDLDWSMKSKLMLTLNPKYRDITGCNTFGKVSEEIKVSNPFDIRQRLELEKKGKTINPLVENKLEWNKEEIDLGLLPNDLLNAFMYPSIMTIRSESKLVDQKLIHI